MYINRTVAKEYQIITCAHPNAFIQFGTVNETSFNITIKSYYRFQKEKLVNSFTNTENEINWYRTEKQEQYELEWYVVCIRGNWMATVFVLAESVDPKRSQETL